MDDYQVGKVYKSWSNHTLFRVMSIEWDTHYQQSLIVGCVLSPGNSYYACGDTLSFYTTSLLSSKIREVSRVEQELYGL